MMWCSVTQLLPSTYKLVLAGDSGRCGHAWDPVRPVHSHIRPLWHTAGQMWTADQGGQAVLRRHWSRDHEEGEGGAQGVQEQEQQYVVQPLWLFARAAIKQLQCQWPLVPCHFFSIFEYTWSWSLAERQGERGGWKIWSGEKKSQDLGKVVEIFPDL